MAASDESKKNVNDVMDCELEGSENSKCEGSNQEPSCGDAHHDTSENNKCEASNQEPLTDDTQCDTSAETRDGKQTIKFKMPSIGLRPAKKSALTKSGLSEFQIIKTDDNNACKTADDETNSESTNTVSSNTAETSHKQNTSLSYQEPDWSGMCDEDYYFEILKNGVIADTVKLKGKSHIVFGRLNICDVVMEHPSLSRYHAVVQFRKVTTDVDKKSISVASSGFYLYDLGSTHGSFLNKTRIESKVYHRLHVGHMMKFGGSSRMYILQGPCEDQERESELSVSELIQMGKKRQSIQSIDDDGELTEKNHGDDNDATDNKPGAANKTDEGIDWGLAEDADEEQDLSENPFAISTANEELYLDDPKKTLRGFFEREGSELEYKVEEKGYSHFVCRVELPLDSATGHPIIAEATAKGKKKEAVVQCALEACRILDRHGVLRQAKHEGRKRKKKNWEADDFYDSDDDTFLDRTGMVERKRQMRMAKSKNVSGGVETYDSLNEKLHDITESIVEIEESIAKGKKSEAVKTEDDSLDAYMSSIDSGNILDKKTLVAMKMKLSKLKQEKTKIEKIIQLAKPAELPALTKPKTEETKQTKKLMPLIGSIKGSRVKLKKYSIKDTSTAAAKIEDDLALDDDRHSNKKDMTENENLPTGVLIKSKSIKDVQQIPESILDKCIDVITSDNCEGDKNVEDNERLSVNVVASGEKIESKKRRKKMHKEKIKYEYDSTNPDYAMWLPPDDQRGDGKTHLNEKFGY